MFVLLGVDGLSPANIQDDCYTLKSLSLSENYNSGVLFCDGILHTASSWTTIYTGQNYKQHGIYEFWYYKDAEAKAQNAITYFDIKDVKVPLLWEVIEKKGKSAIVYNFWGVGPPYNYKCEEHTNWEDTWPKDYESALENLIYQRTMFRQLIDKKIDFLGFTNTMPDKLNHWLMLEKITYEQYQVGLKLFDLWLSEILTITRLAGHDFLMVSDHGLPCSRVEDFVFDGWQAPSHNPAGYYATNLVVYDGEIKSTIDVFNFVLKSMK
jgi:predicted AlkP superfamily phosphohydrolase/phosphomutase